jgi:hypothetical protein
MYILILFHGIVQEVNVSASADGHSTAVAQKEYINHVSQV